MYEAHPFILTLRVKHSDAYRVATIRMRRGKRVSTACHNRDIKLFLTKYAGLFLLSSYLHIFSATFKLLCFLNELYKHQI